MILSTYLRSKAARCLPVVLATLFFVGCTTQTAQAPDQSAAYLAGQMQADSAFYLQQMQQGADDSKTNWQLLAIRALLKEGKTQQASDLYAQLPKDLKGYQHNEQLLLTAELKLAQQDYPAAIALLAPLNPNDFDKNQQIRFWQASIHAQQGRPSLTLLRALIALQPLLEGAEQQKNIDSTWQVVSGLSAEQLQTLAINADENVLQGWLDLQHVWADNRNDPTLMKAAIRDWQTRYPQNPAAKMLPTALSGAQSATAASTSKIALLLPLNGQAAVFGQTIQKGFEAAKQGVIHPVAATAASVTTDPNAAPVPATTAITPSVVSEQPVTTQAVSAVDLKVYDTSALPVDQLLAQVQRDGATLVVGPLLKNHVETLLKSNTTLNVLALNQPEAVQNRPNICYFALSPEDEARDAARHLWDQGRRSPLILVPRSALGDRVTTVFAEEWQKLGGSSVLQQKFGSLAELRSSINHGSGIAMSGSPVVLTPPPATSTPTPTLIPASATSTPPVSGGAVDAAYILATPDELTLIKPMIAMNTSSQSGVVLYASSRSAQGGRGPDFRLEMEGLQFSEIPMLAGSNPPLMQQALSAAHNDYSLARLYAMGADAWALANHFSELRQTPGFAISGNTGALTANSDCVINRKLTWLKYQKGQIVPTN